MFGLFDKIPNWYHMIPFLLDLVWLQDSLTTFLPMVTSCLATTERTAPATVVKRCGPASWPSQKWRVSPTSNGFMPTLGAQCRKGHLWKRRTGFCVLFIKFLLLFYIKCLLSSTGPDRKTPRSTWMAINCWWMACACGSTSSHCWGIPSVLMSSTPSRRCSGLGGLSILLLGRVGQENPVKLVLIDLEKEKPVTRKLEGKTRQVLVDVSSKGKTSHSKFRWKNPSGLGRQGHPEIVMGFWETPSQSPDQSWLQSGFWVFVLWNYLMEVAFDYEIVMGFWETPSQFQGKHSWWSMIAFLGVSPKVVIGFSMVKNELL